MRSEILDSLRDLYISDPRPWLIGFSGGKDSTMVVSLKPGDSIPVKNEEELPISDLGFAQPDMSANAFGSDWDSCRPTLNFQPTRSACSHIVPGAAHSK